MLSLIFLQRYKNPVWWSRPDMSDSQIVLSNFADLGRFISLTFIFEYKVGEIQWLWEKILAWIFLKNVRTCVHGVPDYRLYIRKMRIISQKLFWMGRNRQNCRKFSFLDRFLKTAELVHQYLLHVKFLNFTIFLINICSPSFSRLLTRLYKTTALTLMNQPNLPLDASGVLFFGSLENCRTRPS